MVRWNPFLICTLTVLLSSRLVDAERPSSKDVLSETYTIDRLYKSMKGPQSSQQILLADLDPPELLWITGYRAVIVEADGETPAAQEFMCHSNFDFADVKRHNELFGYRPISTRLFTLSQGQFTIAFPEGFGIPIMSDEPLSLATQVLNLNHPDSTFRVRHKVNIDFVRDRTVTAPMRSLFTLSPYGLALVEGDNPYFGVEQPDPAQHGPGCLLGVSATTHAYRDQQGQVFTGHWVVPPGRQVNRTLVTQLLTLPFDTTIHYIAVHLHPFAESLELRDLTTGQSVFKSDAENFPDRIGLARVQYYSSPEGIPIFSDHEYELISIYNNTSDEDQDSMAVMLMYLLDTHYQPPTIDGASDGDA